MKWEIFSDSSYYDMWAVRPVGDMDFNSPRLFHFALLEDAELFRRIAEKANVATAKPKPQAGAEMYGEEEIEELWDELISKVAEWTTDETDTRARSEFRKELSNSYHLIKKQ